MVLLSSNSHVRLARYYLLANGLGFAASYFASLYANVAGLISALVLVEAFLMLLALPLAIKASQDTALEFLKGIFQLRAIREIA